MSDRPNRAPRVHPERYARRENDRLAREARRAMTNGEAAGQLAYIAARGAGIRSHAQRMADAVETGEPLDLGDLHHLRSLAEDAVATADFIERIATGAS